MPSSEDAVAAGWERLNDILIRMGRPDVRGENAGNAGVPVNTPLWRGSTVLFPDLATMRATVEKRYDHTTIYGAMGTPVQHELEHVIAAIEGGTDTQIVSSGLAACTTALLAWSSAGDHCLIPDSCYGPTRRFADAMLHRFQVAVTYYDPRATEDELHALMRPNTRIVYAESPGSHTFEVQDVPLLARVAHAHGARLMLDNTWGLGIFAPFRHGVDISIQALTKYPGGHSDVILGAITVASRQDWTCLRDAAILLGQAGSPEDCWLTLRGLRTMGVRLARQARTAFRVARWLEEQPEVAHILHSALPGSPDHPIWKRDFTGAGPLFGVVLRSHYSARQMDAMIDSLSRFGIGASWGGFESLVLPTTTGGIVRTRSEGIPAGPVFRLAIGLDEAGDLIDDLKAALATLNHG